MEPIELYGIPELMQILKISKRAARKCLAKGAIPARKIGKRWLVHPEALRNFLLNSDRKPDNQ